MSINIYIYISMSFGFSSSEKRSEENPYSRAANDTIESNNDLKDISSWPEIGTPPLEIHSLDDDGEEKNAE